MKLILFTVTTAILICGCSKLKESRELTPRGDVRLLGLPWGTSLEIVQEAMTDAGFEKASERAGRKGKLFGLLCDRLQIELDSNKNMDSYLATFHAEDTNTTEIFGKLSEALTQQFGTVDSVMRIGSLWVLKINSNGTQDAIMLRRGTTAVSIVGSSTFKWKINESILKD